MRTLLVAAAIIVEEGRVLVSRRKEGSHLAGLWECPGGKVEPGEDPREALARELREELGVLATAGEVVEVTFHRYDDAGKAVLLLFFEAALAAASPAPEPIDVAEVAWVPVRDLDPSRFPPADVAVLEKIRGRLS